MPRRCLIIADSPGWCFHRRAEAIQKYAPDSWDVSVDFYGGQSISDLCYERYDLVFLLAPHIAKQVRQLFNTAGIRVPLVVSYNSGIDRKNYNLYETMVAADYVVVNNYAAWQAGRLGVRRYNACNISNGVALETYKNTTPWGDRPPRALWTASKNKADDEHDVKGWQRTLRPLSLILKNNPGYGLEPDFRIAEPDAVMDEASMVDWYNSGRVLFCASTSEGTPNIALEAAACGVTVVTTRVGNMPELIKHRVNGFLVTPRAGLHAGLLEFLEEIEANKPQWQVAADNMSRIIRDWDWSVRSRWYYSLFDKIVEKGPENVAPFSYLNTPPEAVGA